MECSFRRLFCMVFFKESSQGNSQTASSRRRASERAVSQAVMSLALPAGSSSVACWLAGWLVVAGSHVRVVFSINVPTETTTMDRFQNSTKHLFWRKTKGEKKRRKSEIWFHHAFQNSLWSSSKLGNLSINLGFVCCFKKLF